MKLIVFRVKPPSRVLFQLFSYQVIKDFTLIGIVLALVLADVCILTVWETVDPSKLKVKDLDSLVNVLKFATVLFPFYNVQL